MQVKVSIVNSAGGSFCWNYAIDTFYGTDAGDNVCWIYANYVLNKNLLSDWHCQLTN